MRKKILYYIFRTRIRLKDGTILDARKYGIKAFKIPVYGFTNEPEL